MPFDRLLGIRVETLTLVEVAVRIDMRVRTELMNDQELLIAAGTGTYLVG